jgi:hypothetical protein
MDDESEAKRLREGIKHVLADFDSNNGGAALKKLRKLIEPPAKIHVLSFPATATQLQTMCGLRKFGEEDLLVGDKDQAQGLIISRPNHQLCEPCMEKRVLP